MSSPQAAAPAAKPAPPKKPAAAPAKAKKGEDRRFFLFDTLNAAWITLTAVGVAWTLASVRFLFPNVLAEPPSQFRIGPMNQFEPGAVEERFKNAFQVWIVNLPDEKRLVALSTVCTHLGCTPSWLENDQKFKCPCHGSGFYKNGINFEGPAPRPLERHAIYEQDGVVVVDKSKKFQFELGQWSDPQSFITT